MPELEPEVKVEPTPQTPEAKTFDEAYVKKLRQENAESRIKNKEVETSLEQKMSDFQASVLKALGLEPDANKQADKQIADAHTKAQAAEERANQRLLKAEVKSIAAELGLVDADAAFALMDKAGLSIEDDGTVKGVKEALDALLEAKPYLKKQDAAPIGGGASPAGGQNQPPTLQEEYQAAMKAGNLPLAISIKNKMFLAP
jgi:hypothetical protein